MVEGRTYRYNEKTGVWKNLTISGNENGIFFTAMEGGKDSRKTISFKLTPAEAAYFSMVLKILAKKAIEDGCDVNGKKRDDDSF